MERQIREANISGEGTESKLSAGEGLEEKIPRSGLRRIDA